MKRIKSNLEGVRYIEEHASSNGNAITELVVDPEANSTVVECSLMDYVTQIVDGVNPNRYQCATKLKSTGQFLTSVEIRLTHSIDTLGKRKTRYHIVRLAREEDGGE